MYLFFYSLACIAHQDTIQKLTKNLAGTQVTLEALGVKKPFHLDEKELANLLGVPRHSEVEVDKYTHTKEQLKQCHYEQSPIAKLELVYNALKFTLAQEIDTFWQNTNRIQPDTNLDIDNLQGLCIYLIGQL